MPDVTKLPPAPAGAQWRFAEVNTNHGQDSLGERPLLEWVDVEGARAHMGDEGVCNSLNGTSLLVSYQGIARRITIAGKAPDKNLSDDEIDAQIAAACIAFKPGKRGEATPASGAARSAKALADSLGDKGAEGIKALLDKIKAKAAAAAAAGEEFDVASIEIN